MSYDSSYSLKIESGNNHLIELLRNEISWAMACLTEDGNTRESFSWNTFKRDISLFSKKYKNEVFIITRYGENRDDVEKVYFRNGRMQIRLGKIVFESFDETS